MIKYASVAQWIEHQIPVLRVGGSSPFRRAMEDCQFKLAISFYIILRLSCSRSGSLSLTKKHILISLIFLTTIHLYLRDRGETDGF